ncbi:Phytosulfokine protein [Dioscorea alata]|uniref:Phytosulfokine protein n=1 Tax=Dioscorea alata TaxID=55571 RepID=A0ACB7UKA2_DIOAL|nr:Phytosulfokine protein [Dioscorea alata]
MSKTTTIVFMALLLFFSFSQAIRHDPSLKEDVEKSLAYGKGCEGVEEEECLERRTLVAHTDYIYTQKEPHH